MRQCQLTYGLSPGLGASKEEKKPASASSKSGRIQKKRIRVFKKKTIEP
jgi:hypothetical protein